jgi:aminoglycoside 2''-phosphotransferase
MDPFSAQDARAAVRRLTPVPARDVNELGRGTDSVAYLVDGEWVFRFPAVANARRTLRRELALLPRLGPALPLASPTFEHVGRREDGELLFVGYRVLPGVPLTPELLSSLPGDEQEATLASLADFLRALHAFPVDAARAAGVGYERLSGGYHDGQRDLPRSLAPQLTAAEVAHLEAEFAAYDAAYEPSRVAPALLHSDLKPEHILYDTVARRVTGVLDWGDVCLGDPDFDLAVVGIFFGEDLLARLLHHLPDRDPPTLLAKARFFTTVRRLTDLEYDVALGLGLGLSPAAREPR